MVKGGISGDLAEIFRGEGNIKMMTDWLGRVTPLCVSAPLSSSRILITILSPVAEQRRNLELVYRHFTDRINITERDSLYSSELNWSREGWEVV